MKSLPHIGTLLIPGQPFQGGYVYRQVGGPVYEGDALHQRRVSIDHRGGDALIVVVQPANEAFYVSMNLGLYNEFFGRGTPDHYQPVAIIDLFEAPDIVPNCLHGSKLRARNFGIGPVDSPHVIVVEHCRHGLDRLQEIGNGLQLFVAVQNACLDRRFVGVVGDGVPRAEYQLVELCQLGEVAYQRSPLFGPLAEADGRHLGDRAKRPTCPTPDVFDTGNKCRRHRSQTNQQDAKFATSRPYAGRVCRNKVLGFQADTLLKCKLQEPLVPLRRYPPRLGPVLHRALTLAQQCGQRGLATETVYNPPCAIHNGIS